MENSKHSAYLLHICSLQDFTGSDTIWTVAKGTWGVPETEKAPFSD